MPAFEHSVKKRLSDLKKQHLFRELESSELSGLWVERAGKKLLSFSGNDYLGLSQDKRVVKAAKNSLKKYGAGAGASRLITGNHPLYATLEKSIARIKKTESACVFGSGYLANLGLISTLAESNDLILADKAVHACMIDGIRLSGASFQRFKHNDVSHLEQLLQTYRKQHKNCFILTETVFSMDGDLAPMKQIQALAKKYNATTISDDAHGMGIIENEVRADIQMGTFSKSAGSYGGYIAASKTIIDFIKTSARTLMFSTALPPAVVAASVASLAIMRKEKNRGEKALSNAKYFTKLLDLPVAQSAIVPLIIGAEKDALLYSKRLMEKGFLVTAIRPPTVPKGTARLRFTFTSQHKKKHIDALARALQGIKK